MLPFVKFAVFVLLSSTIAGVILGLIVKAIVENTPAATRIASDPKLIQRIIRAIEDLDSDNTVTLEELSVVIQRSQAKQTGSNK